MLTAYGDDSADRVKAKVFAVALIVGTSDQWKTFKRDWEKRNGKIAFHATDCESGWGDYRGISRENRTCLYRDLVGMLADSDLFGFASAVSIEAYRRTMPTDETLEMPYYACFSSALAMCAALGSVTMPPQGITLTFDQNFERDPSTQELYAHLAGLKTWEPHKNLMGRVTFADHRRESGIQVADLLARETMKHMENTMLRPRERWSRISFMRLQRNPRINFHFVDEEEIQTIMGQCVINPSFHEEYRQWRVSQRLKTDNIVSRLRYLEWRDKQEQATQTADTFSDEDLL